MARIILLQVRWVASTLSVHRCVCVCVCVYVCVRARVRLRLEVCGWGMVVYVWTCSESLLCCHQSSVHDL